MRAPHPGHGHTVSLTLTLLALGALGAACSSSNKNSTKSSSEPVAAASASTGRAKRGAPTSAFLDVLGENGLRGLGMLDGPHESGMLAAGVVAHSSEEPAVFSAGWVGAEAADVLQRARSGDLTKAEVSTPSRDCLIFHEDGIVRRLMTNDANESHEYAMSAKGNILLWLRAAKDNAQSRQLAFFHAGKDLKLYQAWEGNGARRTENAPAGLREYVFDEAKDCFNAFHAKNPTPGTGAPVAAPPPPPPPPPAPPAKVESGYTFKIDAVSVRANETIHVTFSDKLNAPSGNQFWITVVPANAPDSEYGTWHYLQNGVDSDTLAAPAAGDYEIRLHDAFPTFTYRVMARQRIAVTASAPPVVLDNGDECATVTAPGTVCKLSTGLRGICDLTAHLCIEQCMDGSGLAPDGRCYPACPANGNCGDGCSCSWDVCVCPPGD